jgi:uncharacterized protein YfaS (alpha-2-macroglobulin family)
MVNQLKPPQLLQSLKRNKRFIFELVLVFCALALFSFAYDFARTKVFINPEITTTIPSDKDTDVPLDSSIFIAFSMPMNRTLTSRGIYINGKRVTKGIVWSGNTLTVIPDKPFVRDQVITVDIKSAVSRYGIPAKSVSYSFTAFSNPNVAMVTPQGNTPEQVSDIVMLFSKGVKTTKENIFTINPEVEGTYKWVGNTAFIFEPKELAVGQRYTVALNRDLQATDGGTLPKGYTFNFVNMSPEILNLKIDEDTSGSAGKFNPIGTIFACFNQQVELDSAKNHMYFNDNVSQGVRVGVNVSGFYEYKTKDSYWSEYCDQEIVDGRYIVKITPIRALKPSNVYTFKVEPGILGYTKSSSTTLSRELALTPSPLPGFKGFSIANGAKNVDYEKEIRAYFTSPMASSILESSISVNGQKGFYEYIGVNDTNALLSKVLEPSTTYTITIPSGISDKFGRTLPNGGSVTFTTKALTPYLSVSIYPRNQKFTNFADNIDKRVIARTANIPKLEYNLFEITAEQYAVMSSTRYSAYSDGTFGPDDLTASELTRLGVKKVGTWTKSFDISPNVITDTIFNFNKDAKYNIKPGFYVLSVKDATSTKYQDAMLFFVGDTALTAKLSHDGIFVWAASTSKQEVKPNYTVEVYKILVSPKTAADVFSKTNSSKALVKKLAGGRTDSQGVSQLKDSFAFKNIEPDKYYVVARGSGDVGFVKGDWDEGISYYDFANVNYDYSTTNNGPKGYKVFALTDRTLYRPGQRLSYKILIRENKLFTYSTPHLAGIPIKVTIHGYDASWNLKQMYEKEFTDSAADKTGEFTIPASASTGTYSLGITSPTGLFETYYSDFSVQYYQRPDFEVTSVVPDSSMRNVPQTLKAHAKYFYGSPVSGADASYSVFKRDFIFNSKNRPDFKFYSDKKYFGEDYSYDGFEETQVTDGEGTTSVTGDLSFTFVPENKEGVSNIYTVETEVLGPSGRKFSGNNEFVTHMAEVYLGIKNNDYSVEKGKESKFSLIALNHDEKQIGGLDITVDIFRRKYFRIKKQDSEGYFYYETSFEDILEKTLNTTSTDSGEQSLGFSPEEGGLYIIEARTRDSKGNTSVTDTRLYVSSSSDSGYWQQENHDRVEVITDRDEYKVGDSAKVLTTANIENGVGLLTVEAEGVVYHKVFKQNASGNEIDLPISDKFVPNVYVSTLIIGAGKDVYTPPQFKMGITNIKVDSSLKRLGIEVKPNKQSYAPKEKGSLEISVKDSKGNPIKDSEVTVALVDDALLTISPIKRINVFDYFYSARFLSVRTFQSLITSLDRINANTEIGAKGGSGSKGGAGGAYVDLTRSNFAETALWLPKVKTDGLGKVVVPFTLPDSTTRWNAFVLAQNEAGDKFGQTVSLFTTRRDYFIDPAFPRFLRSGDRFDLAAVIHNTSQTNLKLDLSVKATGITAGNPLVSAEVEAGGSKRVSFKATASSADSARITLTLSSNGKVVDIVEKKLPIYPFGVEKVESYTNSASYEGNNFVSISPTLDRKNSSLKVRAYSSLIGASKELSQQLISYIYQCNEQVSSKLLPQIYLVRFNRQQGEKQNLYLEANIKDGIERLLKTQQGDGGWGFWENSITDSQNTARVLEVLYEAKKDGFIVSDSAIDNGRSYLSANMNSQDPYAVYVLQLVGYDATSFISDAYSKYPTMSDYEKAYLILAMKASPHDWSRHISTLKTNVLLHSDFGSGRVFWTNPRYDWYIGDGTTATAAVLRALNKTDPRSPVSDLAITYLVQDGLKAKQEINTYAMRTSSVAILENYIVNGIKLRDSKVELFINGTQAGRGTLEKFSFKPYEISFSLLNPLFKIGENEIKTKFVQGGKNFYAVLLTSFEPFETVKIESNELGLDRRFYTTEGDEVTDDNFKAGESYFVKLTIAAPNTRKNLVIEDYLPAGVESINGSLTNEASTKYYASDNNIQEDKGTTKLYYSQADHMDDRTALFIDYLSRGVYNYTYAIRAVTPGEYRLRPAQVYEMYSPDIRANTEGKIINILE